MANLDERFEKVEKRIDREHDLINSVSTSLTALSNWQTDHSRKFEEERLAAEQFRAEQRAENSHTKKTLVRLTAFPVAGIAHLVFGQAQGSITSPNAFLPAVGVLVLCLLFPEFRSVIPMLFRPQEPTSKRSDPNPRANGAHPSSSPPAPRH